MPDEKDLREAIADFTGEIEQVPPMASAVKVDGERLYDLHRKGITVEREGRRVKIHAFDLTSYDRAAGTAAFEISCTSGTYVRTLISDFATALENGAYLTNLRRGSVGDLDMRNAAKIEDLNPETINNRIIQPDEVVRHLPVLEVGVRGRRDVGHGRSIDAAGFVGSFRVVDEDWFARDLRWRWRRGASGGGVVGGVVIALGNFDGVHLGHQAVLGWAVEEGEKRGPPRRGGDLRPPSPGHTAAR